MNMDQRNLLLAKEPYGAHWGLFSTWGKRGQELKRNVAKKDQFIIETVLFMQKVSLKKTKIAKIGKIPSTAFFFLKEVICFLKRGWTTKSCRTQGLSFVWPSIYYFIFPLSALSGLLSVLSDLKPLRPLISPLKTEISLLSSQISFLKP